MPDDDPSSSFVQAPPVEEPKRGRKFSEILRSLGDDPARERISVGDILLAMGDRAFGALMLVFALPNVLPTPPGTSSVLGMPLVFLAAQLMLGQRPWLPRVIANRSMLRTDFGALIERAIPWLTRAEKLLHPRLGFVVRPPAEYVVGALCLILAVILVLPIPFGNIPPALAICLFSFGILERDGIWVIAGATMFAVSMIIVGGVMFVLIKGAIFVFTNAFS
jgi:hypothetical protein